MKKNTAGQKWRVFAFTQSTSAPLEGDAANITAQLSKDYAAEAAVADTNPAEIGGGYYEFDLSQAETNADSLELRPSSVTAGVSVVPCPATIFPVPYDSGIPSTQSANMRGTDNAMLASSYTSPPSVVAIRQEIDTNSTKLDAAVSSRSTLTAAQVKTAVEADGSKLDHLWEMTEDDGGVRRLTANALEQAPASTTEINTQGETIITG